jgi:hypothetical protein
MKSTSMKLAAACCLIIAMSSCLKDNFTRTYQYKMYRPVYKTSDEVKANIKNATPQPITSSGKMYILGNYIYLSELGKGIHVINNSNPAKPVNESYINIPGCEDMAASGNTLYADCFTDMMVIDITDPKNVSLKNTVNNIFPDRRYVLGYQIDSGKVIAEWIEKDTTITQKVELGRMNDNVVFFDAAACANCSFLNYAYSSSGGQKATAGVGGSMARFAIQNQFLYTVTTTKLNVLGINQPENPEWKNTVDLGWGIETIFPFKDKLFIGSNTGMQIMSVANPAEPVKAGLFTHATVCDPVIADDHNAYVTLRDGTSCRGFTNQLDVLDVNNIFAPSLLKSYPFTNPHGLSKDGNWLFVCDGRDGLKVLDATKPTEIKLKQTISMADTYDVICLNGLAIVTAKDGLYQYDYRDINNIKLLSKIALQQ